MGSSNSTTMKNTTINDITTDFLQSIDTTVRNTNTAQALASQKLVVHAPNLQMDGCTLEVNQNQYGSVKSTLEVLTDLNDEQTATLSTQLMNAQTQALEQINEDLACCTENEADVENHIENILSTDLQMIIDKTFDNMNYASSDATQEGHISLRGLMCVDSDITINQNQTMELVAQNLSETLMDTLQEGESMTQITNEQAAVVKQTNTGMGTSSSGSSFSSSVSIIVAAIGAAILGAGAKEEGGGGGRRGGASTTQYTKLDGEKSINWGVVMGILIMGYAILAIAAYIIRMYTPEHPCPSEDICEKAWDEIQAQGDAIDGRTLRKYHNCRIRHRAKGIKPREFRPRCEGYCAYLTREAETPGIPANPLKWLFCLKDLFKSDDEEEEEEEEQEEETDESTGEGFKNIPEGYSNYQ
jgi:hypothetical protein